MSLGGSIWASASKLNVTKKPSCIPKLAVYVSLSVIQCYPSSLGWTAGEGCKKEGRTEPTQSLINSRAGLEVQLSPVRPWPKASKRILLWWTWIWTRTRSALKGQRLGVWWGWWEKRAWPGVRYRQLKVKSVKCWKDLKRMQSVVLPCFPCYLQNEIKKDINNRWGDCKKEILYIGPHRWYMRTSVHLLTLGHILNQSCRSVTFKILNVCSRIDWPSIFQGHMQMSGDSDSSLVVLWWCGGQIG